jgi:hypothetical protein
MTSTLEELAYKTIVETIGTKVTDVKEGKFYKMIEKDGINLLDLGKCIIIDCECPSYFNDGMGYITFRFEKNNDNNLLWNSLCGHTIFGEFINIIEYKPENT